MRFKKTECHEKYIMIITLFVFLEKGSGLVIFMSFETYTNINALLVYLKNKTHFM